MSALSDTQNSIVPAGNEVIHDAPEGAAVSLEDVSVAAVVQRVAEIDRDYASLFVPSKQCIKVGAEQITFGDDNFGHSEDGWKHLARRYGASTAYWEQFDPAFKSEIVQYHLRRDEALEPSPQSSDPR